MSESNAFLRRLNAALPKEQRHVYESSATDQPNRPTPATTTPTVEGLVDLGKNAFSRFVQQHVSIAYEDAWAALLDPRLITRTYQALRRIHANLQRVAEVATGSSAVRRRRHDFCMMTAERLQQVEALLPDNYFRPGREAYEALRVLTAAVHKHQAAVAEAKVISEEWDVRLWKAADHAGRSLREWQHSAEGGQVDD